MPFDFKSPFLRYSISGIVSEEEAVYYLNKVKSESNADWFIKDDVVTKDGDAWTIAFTGVNVPEQPKKDDRP
jgi:hypothetical protein